jgi:hypothetical protein
MILILSVRSSHSVTNASSVAGIKNPLHSVANSVGIKARVSGHACIVTPAENNAFTIDGIKEDAQEDETKSFSTELQAAG